MPTSAPPRDHEIDKLEAAIAGEIEHQHELEDRTDRLEVRQSATALFVALGVGLVLIAGIVLVLMSSDDTYDQGGAAATAPGAAAARRTRCRAWTTGRAHPRA